MIVRFHIAAGEVERGPFEKVTLGGVNADILVAGDEILATRNAETWALPDGRLIGAIEFTTGKESR